MKIGKAALIVAIIVVSVVTDGCAHRNFGVGSAVLNCCSDNEPYTSFSLTLMDLPEFLKTTMEEEFTIAFGKKGMHRDEARRDLIVELNAMQTNLNKPVVKDQFSTHLAPGDNLRFQADMLIEMYDSATNKLIWSGSIGRIHDVVPGERMQMEKARTAIASAFEEVLEHYPMSKR